MSGTETGPGSRVQSLRTAAAVALWIEAAGLAAAGVAYGVHAFSLPQPMFAIGLAIFAVCIAVGLAFAGRGLRRGARWSVSAAVTWQALLTLAGVSLVQSRPAVGLPAAAVGAAIGVLVIVASRDVVAPRG
ncbi:hypothetical protein QQX10_08960 [Demequina sp. SYSU T00039]|uniref:Integral membrane protein n=1 Tax=Demequina lignilytica TaxID=3051663 RepID=A0AAW7M6X3_9MICO|nr:MULTISPECIES: hypothetical protein [unclassified Demequina]MDN4478254.1 hypothetical protein [Demequina sp. SYSU T00039-1]MDN4488296.1 hypothetical protein [Demequina sp. SYSU T00039]MDN4490157.1 hypothetical protein [Demequina sp. SYSU T00068]